MQSATHYFWLGPAALKRLVCIGATPCRGWIESFSDLVMKYQRYFFVFKRNRLRAIKCCNTKGIKKQMKRWVRGCSPAVVVHPKSEELQGWLEGWFVRYSHGHIEVVKENHQLFSTNRTKLVLRTFLHRLLDRSLMYAKKRKPRRKVAVELLEPYRR